jgi:hypothetical protein
MARKYSVTAVPPAPEPTTVEVEADNPFDAAIKAAMLKELDGLTVVDVKGKGGPGRPAGSTNQPKAVTGKPVAPVLAKAEAK